MEFAARMGTYLSTVDGRERESRSAMELVLEWPFEAIYENVVMLSLVVEKNQGHVYFSRLILFEKKSLRPLKLRDFRDC